MAAVASIPSLLSSLRASAARFAGRCPYHCAAAAFTAGLACAATAPSIAVPAAAVCLGGSLLLRAPPVVLAGAPLLLAGAAVGDARLSAIDAPGARLRDGSPVSARVHLLERPRATTFGSRAEVRIVSGPARGARLLARKPRYVHWPRRLAVGAELRVEGRFQRPHGRPGANFDFPAHLRTQGIAGELWLDEVDATGRRRAGIPGALDAMRRRAERAVGAGLPAREAALARGMVLGQDERIDEADREDWRASGLAHLLAVSGQNVMLLAAFALPPLAAAGLRPPGRAAALLVLIAVYVPLAGAGPSLQRAGVMGAAGIAAMALSRPTSRSYALLLAAAVTLVLNPRALADPGWQLSFAAVAGILVLGPPLRRAFLWMGDTTAHAPLKGLPRRVADGLAEGAALTVAATLATVPLLAHHFGSVPLAGLPANLLALPAVAPAMWLGMAKAAVGQLEFLVVPADAAAEALGPPTRLPVAYLATLAERFADIPGSQVVLPLAGAPAVLAAYGVIAAVGLGAARGVRAVSGRAEEVGAGWRRWPRGRRHAAGVAGLAVLILLGVVILGGRGPPDRLTVRFLDVGQGDATLIQHPDGTAILFDGGPPEGGVTRLLRRAGVRRLAVVVATHASRDHHGALANVLARVPADLLLDGGDGSPDPGFRALLRDAAGRGIRRVRAIAPMVLRVGAVSVSILSPPPRSPGPAPEDPNPRAVVAIVRVGGFDLLLSADAESEALLPLDLPDVDAMKVPHHGSADPGLPDVLERTRPEVAAIPVGANTYGHPAPPTLAALRRAGVRTYRTDRDGTVSLTVEDGGIDVDLER